MVLNKLAYFRLKMHPPHLVYHMLHPPSVGCCVSNITEQPVMVGGTVEVVTNASPTIAYPYNLSLRLLPALPLQLYYLQATTSLPA